MIVCFHWEGLHVYQKLGGGRVPSAPQELAPMVSVCVYLHAYGSSADEDVNVRVFVCELQGACVCVCVCSSILPKQTQLTVASSPSALPGNNGGRCSF